MSAERPLRVAVVGSGPAAFYAAGHLLANDAEVDMIERLPTPWGLVRLGVAPDHPKLKAVSRAFEKIAQRPGFRFFGNVEVGRDVEHADLAGIYDAVVYAVGAQTDRRLAIPGEELEGSWSATEFVAWYNGHPDFQDLEFDLSGGRAVVIGNGNVALDVGRMLALTAEELAPTDTTDEAIEAIVGSGIHEIVLLGRRGPAQAAFTPPELQELGELAGADVAVDPADLELDAASRDALEHDRERARRNVEILRDFAARVPQGKPKTVRLRFLTSPVAILGRGRVEAVEVVRNELVADARGIRAVPTEEREVIPCGIVFRSVGYRGVALPGIPFDEERGTIPNEGGRVLGADGAHVPGLYCAGWIKRGPTGVIGTNKKDATETVDLLLEDAQSGALPRIADPGTEALQRLLLDRGAAFVEYAGWEAIDLSERTAGEPHGRPRIKLARWHELLSAAGIELTRN
jgi:ferredoxin/flavodoxin---NADP+ reductase